MNSRSGYLLGTGFLVLAMLYVGNRMFGGDLRRYIKIGRM